VGGVRAFRPFHGRSFVASKMSALQLLLLP
jgi:hypothetical protein